MPVIRVVTLIYLWRKSSHYIYLKTRFAVINLHFVQSPCRDMMGEKNFDRSGVKKKDALLRDLAELFEKSRNYF